MTRQSFNRPQQNRFLERRIVVSAPRVRACLAFSVMCLIPIAGATLPAFADAAEAVSEVRSPEERAARQFVTRLIEGNVKDALGAATVPFVLANDTVDDAEELSAKLGDVAKSHVFAIARKLHEKKALSLAKIETLQEPRLSFVAGRSFQPLAIDGLSLVLVRAEGDVGGEKGVFDCVVAVKPSRTPDGDPRVVGFGDD
jgi:hypothetical protein